MKLQVFLRKNRKSIIYTALSIITAITCISLCYQINNIKTNIENAVATISKSHYDTEGCLFIVKELNGKVTVFEYSTGEIIEQLNVFTYSLPQSDRSMLEKGIEIYSIGELIALVEDYTG